MGQADPCRCFEASETWLTKAFDSHLVPIPYRGSAPTPRNLFEGAHAASRIIRESEEIGRQKKPQFDQREGSSDGGAMLRPASICPWRETSSGTSYIPRPFTPRARRRTTMRSTTTASAGRNSKAPGKRAHAPTVIWIRSTDYRIRSGRAGSHTRATTRTGRACFPTRKSSLGSISQFSTQFLCRGNRAITRLARADLANTEIGQQV